jgi:PAS domain S-box-containing protein
MQERVADGADVGPIRVLVADDEPALRDAIAELLASEDGFELVGSAGDAGEAAVVAETATPDVALVDVKMPGGGPAAVRGIKERSPTTHVVALSAYEDRATAVEMLRAGAVGYLVKGVAAGEIVEALRRAVRGQASLSAEMTAGVIDELVRDTIERQETEQALRRSEEKFRALIESSPDAAINVDAAGTIVLVNEQTEALFGYARKELLGRNVEMLIPARFREQHLGHRGGYMSDPRKRPMGVGLELAGLRKDGSEFPVDISLSTIETPDGAIALARVRDITERKHAEVVRRKSEERFAALLESAPDGVAIVDQTGEIVLVNKQTEALFGYTREELIGQKIELLLPARFHDRHLVHRGSYFSDARTRPMGADLKLAGLRKDGSEFPVDISLSAVDTDEGRLATAFIRDVTERKAAEEVDRRSRAYFAALLESAPDAVVIADGDGRITLVNKQTESLFGYRRGELLGEKVETLLPDRFHERHVGHRADYIADPRTRPMGAGLELAGRRKDGSEFPVDISLSTIETADGRLLTAFVRDITERRVHAELERDIATRRELLSHLVSTGEEERRRIANDIHDDSIQAITAAGMRLQVLRKTLHDPLQLDLLDHLERTISLSIARLRHLLFELLPPALDHDGLVPALRLYLAEAAKDGDLHYRLDDRLSTQPSQETRLIIYRIAQEALTNIRKHAHAATAQIQLDEVDGGYRVRVADDGVGFTPDEAQPVAGHLGLVAMRERSELAGGWLRIDGGAGTGTSIEFWIPVQPKVDAVASAR